MAIRRKARLGLFLVAGGILLWALWPRDCISARLRWGIAVRKCPEGKPRQTVRLIADGLRRGSEGSVRVIPSAHYTTGPVDEARSTVVLRGSVAVTLLGPAGKELELVPKDGFRHDGGVFQGQVALPADLPDGDWKLRARVKTPLGESEHELALPVYAPARIHLLADRPLYRPGDTLKFRALALRARDLAPLEQRPGRFLVEDPSGETVLEEKAVAGAWGVAAGSFPLDAGAPEGTWKISWVSGGAQGQVAVRVEPFRLPRLRVEAAPLQPFHRAGDKPRLAGFVRYSSGAPVANAPIELKWSASGAWPPPRDWLSSALPQRAVADASGHFAVQLPEVPRDLLGQATLRARLIAVDPAGERVEGAAAVLLSEDAIAVSAVTELAGGLVEGFNNRVYLRAVRADGVPLPGAELLVRRAWDAGDKGITATADEDGVAALQLDPGPPVNVVVPPQPVRPQPPPAPVSLGAARDLLAGGGLSLADRRKLEGALSSLAACAAYARGEREAVQVGLRVDSSGRVLASATAQGKGASSCAAAALQGARFEPGKERLLEVPLSFSAAHLPQLELEVHGIPSGADVLEAVLEEATRGARSCLPASAGSWQLPRILWFRTQLKSKAVVVSFGPDPRGGFAPPAIVGCIEKRLGRLELEEPAAAAALGFARLSVRPPSSARTARPQATTWLGYELLVSARRGGKELGSARLRVHPGEVPGLRLRATPVLAEAGKPLLVELLRGPSYSGALPEKVELTREEGAPLTAILDPKTRKATFAIPENASGWLTAQAGGARALSYVRPAARLEVEIGAEQPSYKPGQTARLLLHTKVSGRGAQAAVSLFGVDESLGQLAALPGPEELAQLRPRPAMSAPAFGALEAHALAVGRIRGANAAAATVLQVTSVPAPGELDVAVAGDGASAFDPSEELADHFYAVLAELQGRVRTWEEKAPEAERMQPATMARLWDEATAACEKRGESVRDAYGRPLKLSRLPSALLSLTEPRSLVVQGTRLPEDVESWAAYVAKEQP